MTAIRFGLVGAGAIAASCCNAVKNHPDGRLAAVTDTNTERAQALAELGRLVPEFAMEASGIRAAE